MIEQYKRMIQMLESCLNKKQYLESLKTNFVVHKYEYTDDDNMKFSLSFTVEFADKVDGTWYYKTIDKIIEFALPRRCGPAF